MVHSFRKEEENMKGKIVFQGKKSTLSMCFCVRVVVTLCSVMQLAIPWYVIMPTVFHAFPIT